jgi:hypothetical protein
MLMGFSWLISFFKGSGFGVQGSGGNRKQVSGAEGILLNPES